MTLRAAGTALALAALAAPAAARAQALTVSLASGGAVYAGQTTTLTFTATYTNANPFHPALHGIDVSFPVGYTVTSASGPSGDWTFSTANDGVTARFLAPCTAAGLVAGESASFTVTVARPAAGSDLVDTLTGSGTSVYAPGGTSQYCEGNWDGAIWYLGSSLTVPVSILRLTGAATPAKLLGPGASSTVVWTIHNGSDTGRTVTFDRIPGGTSGTGWTASCGTDLNGATISSGASSSMTCTYGFQSSGTFSFTGTASAPNAAPPSAAVAVDVGAADAAWDHGVVVLGRATTLTLTNASQALVGGFEIRNASAGGLTVESASATNGLLYQEGSSNGQVAVFTGTLAAGASATVTIRYGTGGLTSPTSTGFTFDLIPTDGSAHAISKTLSSVPLVLPLPRVLGLGVLSNANGRRLDWTRASGNGATPAGVVVFRSDASTVPPVPTDFRQYRAGVDAGVAYADTSGASTTDQTYAEAGSGSYNYRVCSHDASFIYSECESGYWNTAGWLDSAVPPAGGWTRQVGASSLDLVGMFQGGRAAVPSNQGPTLTVLSLSDGTRASAPTALTAMPAVNTVGAQLPDGRYVAFAADQNGVVTAVDVVTGARAWPAGRGSYPLESFVAGSTGIARSAAPPAFQAAYSTDVLVLGSATTGNVLGVDAATGEVLWTVPTGSPVYALPTYDPASNVLYVPANDGVFAYDLTGSSAGVAPQPLPGWTPPGGSYTVQCTRTTAAAYIACVDRTGVLRVLDKATGAVHSQLSTGVSAPAPVSLVRMSAGTPGFVVGSAAKVVRITASADLTTLVASYTWAPGETLSPPLGFSVSGYLIVAASDQRLHKLSSETLAELGRSEAVLSRDPTTILGAPSWDSVNRRYVFGTGEGRIWAVPAF